MKNSFNNTGKLVRFILRRERLSSTLWIVLLSLFSILLAPMLESIFDRNARIALIETINNPAMIAMLGPIYGMEDYTAGAMYFNMMIQWLMITVVVMNIMLVVRHTRSDEEYGRIDMIRSLPTGRLSNLSAVMLTAVIINLVLAIITGVGIAIMNIESMGWNGSMLYSMTLSMVGLVFAALTAIFAQLCSTSRGAIGLSIVSLGFFYLLRGAGDVGNEALAYISPLGLAQRTKAYVENDWLPIFILLAEAIVLTVIAFVLNSHRDIRQGYLPEKKGREHARAYLCSPFGLAFRLVRMPFFGWILGMYIIGASYGSILGTIDNFVETSEFYSMMIGANPDFSTAQMFVSMVNSIMALCAVIPVVMMVLKLHKEEKEGYYVNVLSLAVSRQAYMASYVLIALIASILVQCAAALGIYTSAVAVLPDPGTLTLGYLLKANLVYVPALWCMLGLTILLIGLLPRMTAIIWGYFGFSFFVTFLRRLPDFIPEWLANLTPFTYIPNLPIDEIDYSKLVALTGIGVAMAIIGFAAYRRRDIMAR